MSRLDSQEWEEAYRKEFPVGVQGSKERNMFAAVKHPPETKYQTTSFNDFSIETGILLQGNGVSHAILETKYHTLANQAHRDAYKVKSEVLVKRSTTRMPEHFINFFR